MAKFDDYRDEHIAAYGPDNDQRLTGTRDTVYRQILLWHC